jgi:serine/threonine protein phosphatase PrpC
VSGEAASRLACNRYVQAFSAANGSIGARMEQSLDASNAALSSAIREDGALKGMGCTLIAAYLTEEGLRWVSVGDSALLLYRAGTLRRLNADHSVGAMLNRQVEAGLLAPETALSDPRRRALRSALTGGAIPLKDCEFTAYELKPSDWIVLASDGLDVLSGDEIASIIQGHERQEPDGLARSLIAAVEEKGEQYQDNTTVIVMGVRTTSKLLDKPTDPAGSSQQDDANLPKTVLIEPRGKPAAVSVTPNADSTPKETPKRSWWSRTRFLMLAGLTFGATAAIELGDRLVGAQPIAERTSTQIDA